MTMLFLESNGIQAIMIAVEVQMLRERATLLRFMYSAYLVSITTNECTNIQGVSGGIGNIFRRW